MKTNQERIEALKNKYKNERCFIIGNGPSLRFNDLSKVQNEYVISATYFPLHREYRNLKKVFHCLATPMVWVHGGFPLILYNSMLSNSKTIYFVEDSFIVLNKKYRMLPENRVMYIDFFDPNTEGKDFSIETDLNKPIPYAVNVTSDMLFPVAFYLGFEKIYLIGHDGNLKLDAHPDWSHSHFYSIDLMPPQSRYHMTQQSTGFSTQNLNNVYSEFKKYFEKHNKKVYNATHEGDITIFERVDYDSLF